MRKSVFIGMFLFVLTQGVTPVRAVSPAQAGSRPKAFLVVTFDVEDYISPESEHIDDIPKWLAEIMSEEGVTGTFFVIGEKARSFEKRGRRDVIAAMAKHDIGSHTNFGSIHPTVTEELEKAGKQLFMWQLVCALAVIMMTLVAIVVVDSARRWIGILFAPAPQPQLETAAK